MAMAVRRRRCTMATAIPLLTFVLLSLISLQSGAAQSDHSATVTPAFAWSDLRYYKQGARFAKWRAVLRCDNEVLPSTTAILENCHGLACYAHICKANGLVSIVEPEVTLGEGDYSIDRIAYISEKVNSHVFRLLNEYSVILEGILLKPNMILLGLDVPTPAPQEVARYTVRTMLRSVPGAVPGIHFLSGGMIEEEATLNLQAL